jgi:hypothetical protein
MKNGTDVYLSVCDYISSCSFSDCKFLSFPAELHKLNFLR